MISQTIRFAGDIQPSVSVTTLFLLNNEPATLDENNSME